VLEKVADGEDGNGISREDLEKLKYSDKKNFGYVTALLVRKTLDIFKTHSLKWDTLPGINIRIFRNLNYGGGMDLALEVQGKGKFYVLLSKLCTEKAFKSLYYIGLKL
jgi:hypothetical protein